MKQCIYKPMLAAVFLLLSMVVRADFHPETPDEPQANFRLTTLAQPVGAGSTSGSGSYMEGTYVQLRTSANEGYEFSHWVHKRTGQIVGTSQNCTYVTSNRSDTLLAVYTFNPNKPSEPNYTNPYHLYLSSNIEGSCSFNRTSGAKAEVDEFVPIEAYVSVGYEFVGWFADGIKVADTPAFVFQMTNKTTTLYAQLRFNPVKPDEPGTNAVLSSKGDINADGVVNVMDATMLIGAYLRGKTSELPLSSADVNQDGIINVMDATEIITIFLQGQ